MDRRFLTLEELEVARGKRVAASSWLALTQSTIDDFAYATYDEQWLHVDVERAQRESPYKQTVSHGMLLLSVLPELCRSTVGVTGSLLHVTCGFDSVRFIAPVVAGAEIRVLLEVEDVGRGKIGADITWRVAVEVRGSKRIAVSAIWLSRVIFEERRECDFQRETSA